MVLERQTDSSAANERYSLLELPTFTGGVSTVHADDDSARPDKDSGKGSDGAASGVKSSNDTGTVSDDPSTPAAEKPASTGKSVTEGLLGRSSVRWGDGSIDYPTELDLSNINLDGIFPNGPKAKPAGDKPAAGADGDEPAAGANGDKPAEADGDKQAGADADKTSKGGSDWLTQKIQKAVVDLPNLIVETTKAAPDAILKAATDANTIAMAEDLASNLASFLGIGGDKEAQRIVANAERGKQHIDAHDEQYLKQWKKMEPAKAAPPQEGDNPAKYTHKNPDGSSYTVTDGKISELTTAPSKQNPKGLTYSDITYDKNGDVNSYVTGEQKHRRMSGADTNGIARWRSTNKAETIYSDYAGAGAAQWTGKPVFDANGFHNLITSGNNRGSLISTEIDGSLTKTKPTYDNYNRLQRIETTTTLSDNTKVTRSSKYNQGQFTKDDTNIKVREGDSPKVSQVKFDETGKNGEVVEAPKAKDPAKPGDKLMSFLKDVVNPDSTSYLKDVRALALTRTGPNSFDVRGNLNNVYMEPPNVSVGGFGPLGRVSATPKGSVVNNFDGQLSICDNRVSVSHMHGFNGEASLSRRGIFGRTKNIGSTVTSTKGMTWDTANNQMHVQSDRTNLTLDARNFDANSMSGRLLTQPELKKNVLGGLKTFNESLDQISLVQKSPGVFEGSFDTKQKQFDLGGDIPGIKTKLYLNDKVNFTKGPDGVSFKEGDLVVGLQLGSALESRTSVSKLSNGVDKNGKPVIKVEFHGKKDLFEIPLTPKTPEAKPKDAAPAQPKEAVAPPKAMPSDGTKPPAQPGDVKPDQPKQVVPANTDKPATGEAPKVADRPTVPPTDKVISDPKPAIDQVKPKAEPSAPRQTNNFDCNTNHRRRGIFRRR